MINKQKRANELNKFRKGDSEIIMKLYGSITAYVLGWKRNYKLSDDDISDIVQNTMYKLIKNLRENTTELTCTLTTYALGFTKNTIMQFADENTRFKRIWEADFINDQISTVSHGDNNMELKWKIFNDEFRKLSKECQALLELKMEQYKQKEIAEIMNTESVKYIKKRTYLCRQKFTDLIQNNPNYKNI